MNSKQIPQNPFVVLDDELPAEYLAELIELQQLEKVFFFRLGDIANNIWRWCIEHRAGYRISESQIQPFTYEQICWYIGRKLDGKHGAASIANYARIASRVKSKNHRLRYAMLPISHFEYSCQFDDGTMIKVLELDLKLTDERGGKPPSRINLEKAHEPERFEIQANEADQAPAIELGEYFPDDIGPIDENDELPVYPDEIDEVNAAFQMLRNALQKFHRRNPTLGFVMSTLETITALNQQLMQTVGELLKEKVEQRYEQQR